MNRGEVFFGNVNLLDRFGLYAGTPRDVLFAPLRERKITIPNRNGKYDFGAKSRDERMLSIPFVSSRSLTRSEIRELSFVLDEKNMIRVWDEPEKSYFGRIYDAIDINRLSVNGIEITLDFVCDPFAFGEIISQKFDDEAKIEYNGSAETPATIIIKNLSNKDAVNIKINAFYKR